MYSNFKLNGSVLKIKYSGGSRLDLCYHGFLICFHQITTTLKLNSLKTVQPVVNVNPALHGNVCMGEHSLRHGLALVLHAFVLCLPQPGQQSLLPPFVLVHVAICEVLEEFVEVRTPHGAEEE